MVYSKKDCLNALDEAEKKLGKSPSRREYRELDISPSAFTIGEKFGSWNAAKEKANLESFSFENNIDSKSEDIDLPEEKEWRNLSSYQRYYYKNRPDEIERTTDRKEKLKNWFQKYKNNLCCEKCGEEHNACLEFHHDRDKKESISSLVKNSTSSKERIKEEIEKCRILCANCHRKVHFS